MCIKNAVRASVLCMIPGATGLLLGGVTAYSLTMFIGILVFVVALVAYYAGFQYKVAGAGSHTSDCPEVQVSAGVCLALSFLAGYWSGLSWSAGHGLFVDVLLMSVGAGLAAAFMLTVVKNIVEGRYPWVGHFLDRVFPDRHDDKATSVKHIGPAK